MPAKVLIWNLERFGDRFPQNQTGAALSQNLIASLIADLGVDVVLIQELRTAGVAWLPNVVQQLNVLQNQRNWRFDWIEGGTSGGANPQGVGWGQMSFNVTNDEGYAALWRDNVLQGVNTQRSGGVGNANRGVRQGQSYLDVCLSGNAVDPQRTHVEPKIARRDPLTATVGLTGYPLPCGTAALRRRNDKRRPYWVSNPDVMVLHGSRRPVYVTARVGQTNYDVVAYHAPNADHATMYGPILAFNATTANAARETFAGDWNTISPLPRRSVVATSTAYGMTSPIMQANNPQTGLASMIHACEKNDDGSWQTAASIFTRHRDFAVLAGGNGAAPAVTVLSPFEFFYNPLNRDDPDGPRATYDQLAASKANIVNQAKTVGWPARNNVTSAQIITAFFACFNSYDTTAPNTDGVNTATNGVADFSTSFALLYNRFVSDHLPVQVTLA